MGLTSESDVKEAMKLCMFDLRRGQTEGQELDKILFFYPADLPITNQLSVIGLSEGLITFTRLIFAILFIITCLIWYHKVYGLLNACLFLLCFYK